MVVMCRGLYPLVIIHVRQLLGVWAAGEEGMLHSWQLLQLLRPSKAQSQSLLCSWQSSEPRLALALGLTHYVYC